MSSKRNKPCKCGSGKKYKKCCMKQFVKGACALKPCKPLPKLPPFDENKVRKLIVVAKELIDSGKIQRMQTSGRTDVSKSEKIEILSTVSAQHFTESIAMNAQETENLTGLVGNRYMIRGVNIQSIQPIKFRLIFWGTDGFNDTALDTDSYIDDVELDMSEDPAFRIDNTGQYYLNGS